MNREIRLEDNEILEDLRILPESEATDVSSIPAEILEKEDEEKQAQIERYREDTRLRRDLMYCVLLITFLWLLGVLLLLSLKQLNDSVFITLLTTTTANILILSLTLTQRLFPEQKQSI
jgi:uncharacterized membrane protein